MRMKPSIYIMFFFFLGFSCSGQRNLITKSELKKVFRKSILQESSKWITTVSNPWVSDNTDSVFYKSKTIKLTNYKNDPERFGFCQRVNWTFFSSKEFIKIESQSCKEPASSKAATEKDYFFVKFIKFESEQILELYNSDALVEKFKVISLVDLDVKSEIILKRLDID